MSATTSALVASLDAAGQDFEFYPTTNEIISALVSDLKRGEDYDRKTSVLDIGAGTGKVLTALRDRAGFSALHAIEKSLILCDRLPADVLIVGTDFTEQSLLSKNVDVIFCNPPYSEFESWAVKIIRQAASHYVYLVIPERWENSIQIADALKYREATAKTIGRFDFESAEDRRARAKVSLIRISLSWERHGKDQDDAFERFFKETFADLIGKFEEKAPQGEEAENNARFGHLVIGPSYIESLVSLYDLETAKVQRNFQLVSQLDADLLREFNISPATIMACLKTRLAGMRSVYWHELFSHLDTVTDRLTSGSRRQLLDTLQAHVHVDFTISNIYAVMIWVIKNSNIYIESQLLKVYEIMVDKCNVKLYKSNARTWQDDRWRYQNDAPKNTHFALDYRIVTHQAGGVDCGSYSWEKGLSESAALFMGDLLTIANNLGFKCTTNAPLLSRSVWHAWTPGQQRTFFCTDKKGQSVTLFDVRGFKNRNLHIRFNQQFILALNVEHGLATGQSPGR